MIIVPGTMKIASSTSTTLAPLSQFGSRPTRLKSRTASTSRFGRATAQ